MNSTQQNAIDRRPRITEPPLDFSERSNNTIMLVGPCYIAHRSPRSRKKCRQGKKHFEEPRGRAQRNLLRALAHAYEKQYPRCRASNLHIIIVEDFGCPGYLISLRVTVDLTQNSQHFNI